MKKLLLFLSMITLVACADENKYQEYDKILSWCQRIETSDEHLIYECPGDNDWAKQMKQLKPIGAFKYESNLNLSKLYNETGNVFVEIAFNDTGWCKEDFTIRTMIAKPVEGGDNWAFIGCK